MDYKDKTIFIAIAAYNEIYIEQTISNAIEMAKFPNRLRFGVFSLNSDGQIPSFPQFNNVKVLTAQYNDLLGVCSSRMGALFLYNQEDFFMQIDAHMLFARSWDETLIKDYYNISEKENCKTPLITTRTHWWTNGPKNEILYYDPDKEIKQPIIDYRKDSYLNIDFPELISFDPKWEDKEYFEHYCFSAHFAFTSSNFIFDIMPDIRFMFYGEEMTTSLRAWARGYRMFTLPKNIVWHYNKVLKKENNSFWIEHLYKYDRLQIDRSEEYLIKEKLAIKEMRKILTGEVLGYWGAPDLKSLKEYEKAANIDFNEFYKKRDEVKKNLD